MVITESEAFEHLQSLIATDVEMGSSKALMDSLDEQRKTIEAIEFIGKSGSAAERKQQALSSNAYLEHLNKLKDARYTFEILKQQRLSSILAIDMWRSVRSGQNKGNI